MENTTNSECYIDIAREFLELKREFAEIWFLEDSATWATMSCCVESELLQRNRTPPPPAIRCPHQILFLWDYIENIAYCGNPSKLDEQKTNIGPSNFSLMTLQAVSTNGIILASWSVMLATFWLLFPKLLATRYIQKASISNKVMVLQNLETARTSFNEMFYIL
jgi:hypothetical protein